MIKSVLTFDSFTIGTFVSFVKDGCPDGFLEILEADRPQVGGKWCGTSWGPTLYYSETKRITVILNLRKLSSDQSGYNFDIRIYYKMLKKNSAVVRFGGATPGPYDPARDTNVTEVYRLPEPTSTASYFLGDLISGTYCSRIYSDCNEKPCRLQSPNFPGVYPRNLTCYYAVRQHQVPSGKHAVISVRQPNGQLVAIRSSASLYGRNSQQQTDQPVKELRVWSACDEVQDYITIYDGYTTRDAPLLKFCGGREPVPEVISSGPELLVEFTTSPYGTFLFPGTPQSFHGFQLEVEVHFLDQETVSYTRNKRCEFNIKGSGRGVLESPRHSLTPNTTCTYHLEGGDSGKPSPTFRPTSGKYDPKFWHKQVPPAPPRYKVWLSVLKFKVSPPYTSMEEPCAIRLQIWDGNFRDITCYDGVCEKERTRLITTRKSNVTLLAKYCRDQTSRTCDHELLSNGSRQTRPCSLTESFLSTGNSMTLQLKLQEATALRHVSFKALYEFVDLHQDGETFGQGPCSRRFVSRSQGQQPSVIQKFQSPKDVFLFGRGGNTNLSCIYRFEGKKGERVKINIQNIDIGMRPCKSLYHQDINRVLCHGNRSAYVRIVEYPQSNSLPLPRDCLCSGGDGITPFSFISTGNIVEVHFEVFNMNALDDFRSFRFEGSWEFVRQAFCTRSQQLKGPSGEINFISPSRTPEEINCEYQPWIIEPAQGKYLYVTAKGLPIDKNSKIYEEVLGNVSAVSLGPKCDTKNRILIYTGGVLQSVVCPRPPDSESHRIAEIFSNGWLEDEFEDSALTVLRDEESDRVKAARSIMVEYLGKEDGQYSITWLELGRRKSILPPEGYVMKDCIHKCPELDACINSSLWCDGTVHCPSGYDESLGHCYLIFQLPPLYLAFGIIGLICLSTALTIALFRSCIRRRERRKNHLSVLPSESSLFEEKEVIC
ncbi:hypothetical protein RUM43_005387 [Polyplax serrata]|uniref:CUB domain-containing protein n=1 Tax=Polyplax serrata TaxID=468196 RepID=A0AAN8P966_POLSC